jgi:hypothetical protein
MTFTTFSVDAPIAGRCIYRRPDYAFDFEPADPVEASSLTRLGSVWIAIDTLEIEIGLPDEHLLWVRGYWPDVRWRKLPLPMIRPVPSGVKIEHFGRQIESGFTYRFNTARRWTTAIDVDSGWVRSEKIRWTMTPQSIANSQQERSQP